MGWWTQTKITALEKSAATLEWLARRRDRSSSGPAHLATGLEGEKVGFFYLLRNGYTIAARRWSSNRVKGDLDLVAWEGQTLCIVEVKTRTAHDIVPAELSVDSNKRAVLRRLTRQYIRRLPGKTVPHVRFDILSVYLVPGQEKEVHHFKDAFEWRDGRREWD
jgi:putative endonuclease